MQFRHPGILHEEQVMPASKTSLVGRKLIIALLLLSLSVTSTLIALNHTRSVSAATAPYFSVNVGGETFVAQYAGHGYSNQNSYSVYSDFGQWNEYTVDSSGKWHAYGQFSGNEDVFFNGNGKVQGGVNLNIPGLGRVNTYPHEQILGPNLTAPQFWSYNPSQYTVVSTQVGQESYLGTRLSEEVIVPKSGASEFGTANCEVDSANFDSARFGTQTSQIDWDNSHFYQQDRDCNLGNPEIKRGDAGITTFYNNFVHTVAATHNANSPVVASLDRPNLPIPVILAIAGGIFFIGSVAAGSVCNFATCSPQAKKILAGIQLGLGIISGILGISSGIITALRAYAAVAPVLVPAAVQEAAGAVEMVGALAPALAVEADAQAAAIVAEAVGAVHVP